MRRTVLAVALCGALAGAACTDRRPAADGAIVVGLRISPTNLDPTVGVDEASQRVGQLVFSSLMRIDESLQVVPDLAVKVETSDWQTYIAEIPPGVRFHDGREMTSDDVAFTFRRFLDPNFVSARKGAYRSLAGVEVINRYTVAFRLHEPSASFPINLVMGILPAGSGPETVRRPVGSGPYRVVEFVPDDRVVLDAFDNYYRGAPRNSGLELKVVPDETMRSLELRKGDVDLVVNDVSPDLVHDLAEEPHLQVITAPGTDWAYIGLNLRDPLLDDVRVRHALGYAIDRKAIVQYLRRGLARETPGILPSSSTFAAPDQFQFTHDPAKARALLDEAGYRDPDGDGPAARMALTLKTSTAEDSRVQAAAIQQQLREVGIALDLRSYEFATLMADVVRGNVQLYLLQFVGVTDPDMLRRLYHSGQTPPAGVNRGHYANPEADRLLDLATASLDPEERRKYYSEAQRVIALDAAVLSLWAKTNVIVAQADLTGLELGPTADFGFLRHVSRVPLHP